MNEQHIIDKTIDYVKHELSEAEGGHDWFHIQRVFKLALRISADEPEANPLVVALGALLHDIADSKFHQGDEEVGPTRARVFMESLQLPQEVIDHVVNIIKNISFKGGNHKITFDSPELRILQDADRLDAVGAIGIARCFNYGGFKNRALYDPEIAPQLNMDKEAYKNSQAPSINHFYEKLLLLKDRMHTQTGKEIAEGRHQFMEAYLSQFYAEWEGER